MGPGVFPEALVDSGRRHAARVQSSSLILGGDPDRAVENRVEPILNRGHLVPEPACGSATAGEKYFGADFRPRKYYVHAELVISVF